MQWELNEESGQIAVDPLSALYLVHSNTIKKVTPEGKIQFTFTEYNYGDISNIDVSNPFKILVFYKDYNTLLFLDNTLSAIMAPIYLDDFGFTQVEQVCSSLKNGFWVYNTLKARLEHVTDEGSTDLKGIDIRSIYTIKEPPLKLIEREQRLFLGFEGDMVLVFDDFGNFARQLPLKIKGDFQVFHNTLYYQKGKELVLYNFAKFKEVKFSLPTEKQPLQILVSNGCLYMRFPEKILSFIMPLK